MGNDEEETTTTQLDSHANMVAVGSHTMVFVDQGRVQMFDHSHTTSQSLSQSQSWMLLWHMIPLQHEDLHPHVQECTLRSVDEVNLIPPFIMRETGLVVSDVPRIHTKINDLTDKLHCIVAKVDSSYNILKIPLELDGIFLFFNARKLSDNEVENFEYIQILCMSPDGPDWDES